MFNELILYFPFFISLSRDWSSMTLHNFLRNPKYVLRLSHSVVKTLDILPFIDSMQVFHCFIIIFIKANFKGLSKGTFYFLPWNLTVMLCQVIFKEKATISGYYEKNTHIFILCPFPFINNEKRAKYDDYRMFMPAFCISQCSHYFT